MSSKITIGPLSDISIHNYSHRLTHDTGNHAQSNPLFTAGTYRALKASELEILIKNNNTAEDWTRIMVSQEFDAELIHNSEFWGDIRIGKLTHSFLEHHNLRLPVGIYNSLILSSSIGDNCALRNVRYLANYKIGSDCMLFNIDEMMTLVNAKFGNGVLFEDEDEKNRVWIELSNENGGRSVLVFKGMLASDAYLWSKFRDDTNLLTRFKEMTDQLKSEEFHPYGIIGERTVIKNSRIIKDVNIGSNSYIKGINKLKNLTVQSNQEEPTQIGEGVELVNGIIGFGNRIFYGVKAVRFVTGRNVQLKYGARLLNSYLGDNSTISCCEVLNNLIFPFHEQHHNNSFLIAATIMGQSNVAAGATIGSNHNSRAADGEIIAGRGFWPGLMSNFKHNSVFASFCLVAKGSYHSELNIPLPFALVSPSNDLDNIRITPGFWFKYNMYALARNAWKFRDRDKRIIKEQNIEFDYLAPDTVEEMFNGMAILQKAVEDSIKGKAADMDYETAAELDRKLKITLDGAVNKGKALVIKPLQGIQLYRMMISYYGARELLGSLFAAKEAGQSGEGLIEWIRTNYRQPQRSWLNLGGQIVPEDALQLLLSDIKSGKLGTWQDLHKEYDRLWAEYTMQRRNHGIMSVLKLRSAGIEKLDSHLAQDILRKSKAIAQQICNWAEESREKDYSNPFRKSTYRNEQEMEAVLGQPKDNSFLKKLRQTTDQYVSECDSMIGLLNA